MADQEPDSSTVGGRPLTALIMAGSRKGIDDPVARLQNKSHKCLVTIDGVVMLERVIDALIDSGCFNRIYVSIEEEAVLRTVPRISTWLDEGRVGFAPSKGRLADSVIAAAENLDNPFPLVITTGDNALHTPEFVREFVDAFTAGDDDLAVAFTRAEDVRREYPEVALAYHELKDGGVSACNLYGLRSEKALTAVRVFEGGGQFGKKHMRILKAFGVMPFLLYKLKAVTSEALMRRIGRSLGVSIDTVFLPEAFGPIDVDNPQFFEISEKALAKRRLEAEAENAA